MIKAYLHGCQALAELSCRGAAAAPQYGRPPGRAVADGYGPHRCGWADNQTSSFRDRAGRGNRFLPPVLLSIALLGLGPSTATAQFAQYVAPGAFEGAPAPRELQLREAINDARWRIGSLYLDPWVALREISFDDNVGSGDANPKMSDLTVTLGLGLRAYLPVGGDLVLAAHVLPEYEWWQELSERRSINGRYGAGLSGNVRTVSFEAAVMRIEDSRFLSRQLEDRVNTVEERATFGAEVDLGREFELFLQESVFSYQFKDNVATARLARLNRDEEVLRLGFRRRFRRGVTVDIGVEKSDVEFEDPTSESSNSGDSPFLEIRYQGNHLSFRAAMASRSLEFAEGESPYVYDATTGAFRFSWNPLPFLDFQLFGNRNLVYSIDQRWSFFEDSNAGVGVRSSLGSRSSARLFLDSGKNEYFSLSAGSLLRVDDFRTLGGEYRIRLGNVGYEIRAFRTDYESNLPTFDRTVKTLTISMVIGDRNRRADPWS